MLRILFFTCVKALMIPGSSSTSRSAAAAEVFPTAALSLEDVTAERSYRTAFLKDFDLPRDMSLPYRVFVLRCRQPDILDGGFAYYVGFIDAAGLGEHLRKYFNRHADSARYTKVNEPLGVELLWPAKLRAAEGYLFMFVLGKLEEDAVARHGRLGGWTQTCVKPLPVAVQNALQRDWRMVNDRCLDCGQPGHFAGSHLCQHIAITSKSLAAASLAPAMQPSSAQPRVAAVAPAPMPSEPRAEAAPAQPKHPVAIVAAVPKPSEPKAGAAPGHANAGPSQADADLFDAWFAAERPTRLTSDADNWVPLKNVLRALGESVQNPSRFVDAGSDSPAKLWRLGPGRRAPTRGRDWTAVGIRGGNQLVVKKKFLKTVMLERYRDKL